MAVSNEITMSLLAVLYSVCVCSVHVVLHVVPGGRSWLL